MKIKNVKFSDKVGARGVFQLLIFENGKRIANIVEKNMVVTLGRETMAKLLAGSAVYADKKITKAQCGTNGTATSLADNAITNPFQKTFDAITYPQPGWVRFQFSVASGENNGVTIQEFGLLSNDGTLFNRKVVPPIVKTSAISFVCLWTIKF